MADEQGPPPPPVETLEPAPPGALKNVDEAKMWAMLSYCSMFFGLPLFIVPLAMRDQPFANYHARQAAAIYVGFLVGIAALTVLTMVTCGMGALLFPAVLVMWIPSVHGLMLASQGSQEEPLGLFGMGDRLFGRAGRDR